MTTLKTALQHETPQIRGVLTEDATEALNRLTPNQRNFVLHYASHTSPYFRDATPAYVAAGFSTNNPAKGANNLLVDSDVKKAILLVERDSKDAVETVIELKDVAWLHRELSILADSSILDFGRITEAGGWVLDLNLLQDQPEKAKLIEAIDVTTDKEGYTRTTVKLMRRKDLLDLLGKHSDVQAWRERLTIETENQKAIDITEARQRARLTAVSTPSTEISTTSDEAVSE